MKYVYMPFNWMWKALKWGYGDSWRYLGFMVAMTIFLGFLMTLIAYPIQTIAFLLIGGVACLLFNFFTEVGR